MKRKRKRVLSFLMALSVFMTGSGIGGASAAIAPDETARPEQYTVTLPIYEACDYRYEASHKKETKNANQEITMQYEAGAQVVFEVVPADGWMIDEMQIFGSNAEIPVMITNQTVSFSMPEEPVTFRAQFHHAEETDTEVPINGQEMTFHSSEDGDHKNRGDNDSDYGENELPDVTDTEQSDTWENEDPEQDKDQTDDLSEVYDEDSEKGWSETENVWITETDETTEEEETEESETVWSDETEDLLGESESDETQELWKDESEDFSDETKSEETESAQGDETEEPEDQPEDFVTEDETDETENPSAEEKSEEVPNETEDDWKDLTTQETDVLWEEMTDESDTFLEDETQESVFEEESEMEYESESEMEVPESCYQVLLPKSTEYKISFCSETQWYQPGEEVSFTLEAAPELEALEIAAYSIKDTTVPELARSLEEDQLPLLFEEKEERFYFEMPESNVLLLVNTDDAVKTYAAEDEDPVPDRFKLVVSGVYSAPANLNNGHAASTHKTVIFFESDGSKVIREAYCIQPRLNSPESGTIYDKDTAEYLDGTTGTQKERYMSKGMFYLYGGPAWGRTIELNDGSSVNLKEVMERVGCSTSGNYYTVTHYVLSYFYMNGSNWNYNSNYANVLNDAGVELVKTLASYIAKMPNPNSYLTEAQLQASYRSASDKSITPSTVYKSFEENTATVALPNGITLVNETTGGRFTGKATLNGGDRFHLEADRTVSAGTVQLTLNCKYPVDYQALKLGLSGYQDIGFSYYSGEKQLLLSVTIPKIPEIPKNGTAYVQKLDALSQSTKLLNENYSLAGAVYTVYKDQGCTATVVSLTTAESGKTNQVELEAGTYYVKETKASKGYRLDEKLYTLKVVSGETATFTSYEEPIRKKLSVQKYDAETGKTVPQSGTFEGAEYTVYLDDACTKKAATLVTNKNGYAESALLPLTTYYIKETKAPSGYELDSVVHRIAMAAGGETTVYPISSREKPVKKSIEIQKYDAQTGNAKPYNEKYSFTGAEYTIYSDAGCTKAVETLKTNASGYAKSSELAIATYYVKETKAPVGYSLDTAVHKVAMEGNDKVAVYSVASNEKPVKKFIEIQKYDAQTGNAKPYNEKYSFTGAEYTIYSDAGCTKAVETLKTNASGYAKSTELAIATYYLKETKAPKGYLLDKVIHKVEMSVSGTVTYTVKSEEAPRTAKIQVQKYDAITGKPEPYNGKVVFRGAKYVIYSDASCTKQVETMTTDDSGKAESKELPLGIYYVKEVTAPAGYLLDESVHKVDIDMENLLKVYTVKSNEEIEKRPIEVQKYDKETGRKVPVAGTSFAGAQYSIYSDASCTKEVDVMTTNTSGYAKSKSLPMDIYYVKETKRPNGYELDPTVYRIDMKVSDKLSVYSVNSEEQVIRKPIEVQKYDKETGKPAPNNCAVKFAGAQYTIYEDKNCSKQLEVLKLNASGYAKSSPLRPGTYYLKETKAPAGYEMDVLVHEVTVADDGQKSYQIQSYDPVIRGSLMLMKFLDDRYDESILQDWIDRGELSGIRFTLTHEDPSVPEKEIITDQYGYAATKAQELVYGTWTLREDPATTPEGYAGLKEAKIRITKQDVQVKYVVTNGVQNAMLEIVKKDRQTGNMIPKTGAKFQILDSSGTPIVMQDNLDFSKMTDTFTTNEEGKIYLTKPLKKGSYTLKEIEAPEKYLIAEPLTFTVDGAHSYEEPLVVECFDEMQKGRILIQKKDAQTHGQLGEGFAFEIRAAEDITDPAGTVLAMETPDGSVMLEKGALAAVVFTNADGIAYSPELYIGRYEVREVTAGEFYAVSDQVYEAELLYDRTKASVEAELSVENEKTSLIIQKKDSESTEEKMLPLAGIHFRIFTAQELDMLGDETGQISEELASLGTEYITDENGQIEVADLKHSTIYYIYESETLPGYNLERNLYKISVDADGRINGQVSYTLKISNQANEVEITKWDITGDCELPGAELTIQDADGNTIEHWISEEAPHRIKGLAAGTYTLTEDRAPLGYAVAETITFTLTDSLEVQQVVMNDDQILVQISKKDITGQEELPGAQLEVRAEDGTLIDTWVSAEEPHFLNLAAGMYTLTEIAAPEKYAKAETISFEVRDDMALQKVEMRDAPIQVQISKQDITTEKELPGAQLTVRDAKGTIVADWTSTEEPHFLNLAAGMYTLTEVAAPSGYCKAETITFEVTDTAEIQKVIMYDKPIEVEISKQDITDSKELPGALLTICDMDGNEVDRWYSGEEPHRLQIASGTYVLTEIAAPDYYATAESVAFEVEETGEVQKVVMKDAPLQVDISKKTITGDEELPGAVLKVSDLEGKVLETWISEKEPHRIRLKKGTYELTEITAPRGYEVAETIRFTVEDTMEVQQITMYDKPVPEKETELETESEIETESESETESERVPEETESETLKETESESEKETEKQSETEPKKPTIPGSVKTGDPTNFFPPLFGVISGLLLFTGTLVSGRRKKRHCRK